MNWQDDLECSNRSPQCPKYVCRARFVLTLNHIFFIGQLHRLDGRGGGCLRRRGQEDARREDEAERAGDAGALREGPRRRRRDLQAAAGREKLKSSEDENIYMQYMMNVQQAACGEAMIFCRRTLCSV